MKIFDEVYKTTHKQIEDVYASAYTAIVNCLKLSTIRALNDFVCSIHYIPESAKSLTVEIESFELTEEHLFIGRVKCIFNGVKFPNIEESIIFAKNIPGVLISGIGSENIFEEYDLVYKEDFSKIYIHSILGDISLNDLFNGVFSITYSLEK